MASAARPGGGGSAGVGAESSPESLSLGHAAGVTGRGRRDTRRPLVAAADGRLASPDASERS